MRYLAVGQVAQIGQLVGQAEQVHRLEELGLRRGTTIEMVQSGSPCIIRVAGSKICFRDCDLVNVLVHVGEPV
jgi:Fe2+ transport system protein FeoA